MGVFGQALVVGGLISIPLWNYLDSRLNKRATWQIANGFFICGVGLLAIPSVIAGAFGFFVIGIALYEVLISSKTALADAADWAEYECGTRLEATIQG